MRMLVRDKYTCALFIILAVFVRESSLPNMHPIIAAFVAFISTTPAFTREVPECSCGFTDNLTSSIYTDSLILYLNETNTIDPAILQAEGFAHKKQQGWTSRYRVGADPSNARLVNDSHHGTRTRALELSLDPPDSQHLVNGARLESARKDIQHGSFEAALRPASPWFGLQPLSGRWL